MVMLIHNLGPGYVVWDKSANIRFRRLGLGRVRAREEQIAEIRAALEKEEKTEREFGTAVKDESGEVLA